MTELLEPDDVAAIRNKHQERPLTLREAAQAVLDAVEPIPLSPDMRRMPHVFHDHASVVALRAAIADDERLDGPAPDTRTRLRDAIGTTDADEGLPHWHHASGGTTSDPRENDRAGVFVDRQAVLDAIDKVLG